MNLPQKDTLRLITCGSVDDGKSSLIGRLLFESGSVLSDQLVTLRKESAIFGTRGEELDLALLVDGLQAEREQGITIDVAYRYFSSSKRNFIVADTPGHEQYTRNMATGASNASLAVILIDARKGVLTQTRRHSRIAALMGIRHLIVTINKMDLVGYSHKIYDEIVKNYQSFIKELGFTSINIIPVSATEGDNIGQLSSKMNWYQGQTLLQHLETIDTSNAHLDKSPFRMTVQMVNRPHLDFRGYCGNVICGEIKLGDRIRHLPSGQETFVRSIISGFDESEKAYRNEAITLLLSSEIDISAGDLLCSPENTPEIADQFECHLIWMSDKAMIPGRQFIFKIHAKETKAVIQKIKYEIDVNSGDHIASNQLRINSIAVVNLHTIAPIIFEPYADNPSLGSFILIDPISFDTVAAGMLRFALRRSQNIHWQKLDISSTSRASMKQQKPCCIWMTGLSGSGKSTIANLLEKKLHSFGKHTYILDGDNIRHGLNKDLGFSEPDRVENIRRASEVAKLMLDAGLIVITSFISPFKSDRELARRTIGDSVFHEAFIDTPLSVCESRDPKGLYEKARAGTLENFTGIDSPYELPNDSDLVIDTTNTSDTEAVEIIIDYLRLHGNIT